MVATLFLVWIALVIIGVPIVVALGLSSVIALVTQGDIPIALISQRMFTAMDSFPLLALPLFLLAGKLMETGGISIRLVNFASTLVGHIRAGFAMISVVTSMFFAGISGSAVADTAAIGSILIPSMVKEGYDRDYAASVQATAGSIGVIIPPSVPMVVYSLVGGVSVSKMFLGGFIPGLLSGLSLMVVSYIIGKKKGYEGGQRATLKQQWVSFKEALLALMMPVIILGGVMFGIFTPTEAAVIAVAYAFLIGVFVYKDLKIMDIPHILLDSVRDSAVIMVIIGTASLFGWLLTSEGFPQMLGEMLFSISKNPTIILLIINVMLLIVGTFMETNAAIIMLAPIFLPIIQEAGIDPVFFGIVMVVNLAIGMCTPPVGVCLFVTSKIAQRSIKDVTKTVLPFLLAMIIVLILITVFPQLVMYFPNAFMK
ncbi:TRAP transporter large permease [Petroclostridium sp. X23]|uniref:TRAP transporter large permease n=1 Tax=Petroclostridium sp. X23 TaxID=3045146 RepID=UPI0024AD8F8A|nr:TRAP transporter large permease [Petroclostridium sp. X23]WHH59857.1 TRAP transporter large permease [Petroclostridium sp. X23]